MSSHPPLDERIMGIPPYFAKKYAKPGTALYDDLLSEGYLSLVENAPKWRPDGGSKFSTYLFNGVRFKVWAFLERSTRHQIMSLEERAQSVNSGDDLTIGDTIAARDGEDNGDAEMVQKALSVLPAHYRDVIEKKYILGMNGREISESLACSKQNVQQRLSRALARMKSLLSGDDLQSKRKLEAAKRACERRDAGVIPQGHYHCWYLVHNDKTLSGPFETMRQAMTLIGFDREYRGDNGSALASQYASSVGAKIVKGSGVAPYLAEGYKCRPKTW